MKYDFYGHTAEAILSMVKTDNMKRTFKISHNGATLNFAIVEEREDYIRIKTPNGEVKVRKNECN